MVEVVAVHPVLVLEMPDHWFDGGAAAHLAFDLRRETAPLLGSVDFELVIGRRVVAAVAGVGVQALDLIADQLFDRRDDLGERVPIIRIARQRLGMDGELAALAALEGSSDTDLDAEFVGLVRLTFANAFNFGGVPAV